MPVVVNRPVELRSVLNRWDQASRFERERILHTFISKNQCKTGPELEQEFKNGASLFLTRLCAHLKTSVTSRATVGLTFQAISVFISAASGTRFLNEFIDLGGLDLVVETIRNDSAAELDRLRALQLISSLINCGRKYKQLVVSEPLLVIPAICSLIEGSQSEPVQELSRIVLVNLGADCSSPEAMQRCLISLLRSPHPHVQRTSAQVARQLLSHPHPDSGAIGSLPTAGAADELADAICGLFSTLHAHVMYESLELAAGALACEATRPAMIRLLVSNLRPAPYSAPQGGPWRGIITLPSSTDPDDNPPAALASQAAVSRLVASFLQPSSSHGAAADSCAVVAESMARDGVVEGLLVALANTDYVESKTQALAALRELTKWSRTADAQLRKLLGPASHEDLTADPDGFAAWLDYAKLNALLRVSGHQHVQYFREGEEIFSREDNGQEEISDAPQDITLEKDVAYFNLGLTAETESHLQQQTAEEDICGSESLVRQEFEAEK